MEATNEASRRKENPINTPSAEISPTHISTRNLAELITEARNLHDTTGIHIDKRQSHHTLYRKYQGSYKMISKTFVTVSRSTNYESLFGVLIALNRICRAKGKPPLFRRREAAKELLRNSSRCSRTNFQAQSLASDIKSVQEEFDRLEGMKNYGQKYPLAYSTGKISNLSRTPLVLRVEIELLTTARGYKTIFLTLMVEFIDLQQHGRHVSVDAAPSASDTSQIMKASSIREALARVLNRRYRSISNTQDLIRAQLCRTSRLHTAVQHVLCSEAQQDARILRPEVICSSKIRAISTTSFSRCMTTYKIAVPKHSSYYSHLAKHYFHTIVGCVGCVVTRWPDASADASAPYNTFNAVPHVSGASHSFTLLLSL
ncbi:uncharacterized protein BDR25DRAFT_358117 [Lindgomyces ingoldianus]|uniref:Uncharacterized protein n=1 Tax=Lindgomyces ingoldianus TaxID=673940 RepID=A0ACB6QLI2_9PLEO|nr:uncharacterized protein BDR25DRAFT_358117 [Lindgomyces ingoldianus]KAF2467848.1 hypothetical protein BDR25DRAFT_358117 [Lindgomyces ingoldianus]